MMHPFHHHVGVSSVLLSIHLLVLRISSGDTRYQAHRTSKKSISFGCTCNYFHEAVTVHTSVFDADGSLIFQEEQSLHLITKQRLTQYFCLQGIQNHVTYAIYRCWMYLLVQCASNLRRSVQNFLIQEEEKFYLGNIPLSLICHLN